MAGEKKKIFIGSEYAATFRSLVRILESGCVDVGAAVTEDYLHRKVISTETHDYIYRERKEAAGEAQTVAMRGDGASWFAPVRQGKPFEDGTSEWKQLIYKVAKEFHKKYSIIEYKQCGEADGTDREKSEEIIRNAVGRLFGAKNVYISAENNVKGAEDIYGAAVKLELGGTGQSCYTVMCKIYFRRVGNDVRPVPAREAYLVNARLEEAPDNDGEITENTSITEDTLNAVDKLVNGKYKVGFKDCLCFSDKKVIDPVTRQEELNYDLKIAKELAKRAKRNNAPVTCSSVKVLWISHVKWINDYYDVSFGGKPVLRAVIGFGGSLTLRCLNCGGAEELVSSDTIEYSFADENGVKVNRSVVLDTAKKDLGLDERTLEEIRQYGELAGHLMTVRCKNNKRIGKECVSCACRSQVVEIGGETKCAGCPYPEEVFTDYSGEMPVRRLTSTLGFVLDKLTMIPSAQVAACSRCGRPFTANALQDGVCPLCYGVTDSDEEKRELAKKKYRRYKNVLPHTTRLKHLFHTKYCLEDDTALLFALGKDRYILSKLDLKKKGFIDAPKKIGR